jgi:hypothetical protein
MARAVQRTELESPVRRVRSQRGRGYVVVLMVLWMVRVVSQMAKRRKVDSGMSAWVA